MKTIYIGLRSIILPLVIIMMMGCEKNFLDINTDPNSPTDLPLTQILPAAQVGMAFNLSSSVSGFNNASSTFVHQIVNARVNEYVIDGTSFTNAWNSVYSGPLTDFEKIITKGTELNAPHFVGIAQIQKAYLFSILVDLFGDIPYSEALKGNDNLTPKFDKDSEIYDNLFVLIDQGITNLNAASSSISPNNTNDLIYAGNRPLWIKFANTLKLKLYNQIRLVKNVKPEMDALIASGNLISSATEDFQIKYGTSNAPENRNPGFISNYNSAASRENQVSPFFYFNLKNNNDPRMPYYIYNQVVAANSAVPNPTDFRDGRFVSVRFASQGPNRNQDQRNFQSLVGLFPVGGRYDAGTGGTGTLTNGPSDAPLRLLTFYHRKFIEAEAALTIGTTGNPRQLLEDGMRASFAKVNAQAAAVPASIQTVPAIPAASIDTYVNTILTAYDAAGASGKLEIIMTQKWIATFGFGIDAYTDLRRTGFPAIPDPATDADPETASQRTYPFRFPYINGELLSNPNAPKQPDIYSVKIFWNN